MSCGAYGRNGPRTGVGHTGRTRIRNQGNALPLRDQATQLFCGGVFIVLVHGQQAGANAMVIEQMPRVPGIFTRHDVSPL